MSKTLTIYLTTEQQGRQYCWFDGQHNSSTDASELPRLASGYAHVDIVVPGEDVLLLSADLPGRNRARMIQAMPYAVEDQLAEDVDRYHFALGQKLDGSRYQIAAINRDVMQRWMKQLETLGIAARKIVPDMLCLPLAEGHMTIALDGDRAMVRTSPADGYVISSDEVAVVCGMEPDEKPVDVLSSSIVTSDSDTASSDNHDIMRNVAQALKNAGKQVSVRSGLGDAGRLFGPTTMASVELNLLSGEFRAGGVRSGRAFGAWRWAAVLLALAGLTELVSRGLELSRKNDQLDAIQARQVDIVRQTFPEISSVQFPREQMEQAYEQQGSSSGSGFLGLLASIGNSVSSNRAVRLGGMSFQSNELVLKLSAPDLATIDQLREAIIQSGGVEVTLDSAVTLADSATADMRVRSL